jgi:uncharacterized protein YbjT (DUF2867 family)
MRTNSFMKRDLKDDRKIILVTGATGSQGGSVAKTLLKESGFRVRVLTRNVRSQKAQLLARAGAEVVEGDFDNRSSLAAAMQDVYGVYGVTNFWEHFAKEYQQGVNLVDAAKEAGVQHIVLNTMPDYYQLSRGSFSVPQCDIKAALEHYTVRSGLQATFLHVAFYYENFFSLFPLQKGEDNSFHFGFPQGETRLAMASVEDVGGVALSVFENASAFSGKVVGVVGEDYTCDEYAAIMSQVLRRNIRYNHIPRDVYAAYGFPGAEEIANMFEVQRLFIPERTADLMESYRLNPSMQSFESWVERNKYRFFSFLNSQFQAMVI